MSKKILITGGAGFVGSHLADDLLARGYKVRALDSLVSQVHGNSNRRPSYLTKDVELIIGDVRDANTVRRALQGVDYVAHLAAMVGVGQSMYEIEHYISANGTGTAVLLEALAEHPVKKLLIASSMSIYGEGLYRTASGECVAGIERTSDQIKRRDWELRSADGRPLTPTRTPETKCPSLPSVYAISKYQQERLCMVVGQAYNIPTVALRFFNIYGKRQALSNPYTGVLAIFASRYLNNRPPLINEDGLQRRDFVSVQDVVQACRLALEIPRSTGHVFNVGSGVPHTIREVAHKMARALGKEHIEPEITERYRKGDIRNCFADISLVQKVLGYHPCVTLEDGLADLAEWLESQTPADHVLEASLELASRGLTV